MTRFSDRRSPTCTGGGYADTDGHELGDDAAGTKT